MDQMRRNFHSRREADCRDAQPEQFAPEKQDHCADQCADNGYRKLHRGKNFDYPALTWRSRACVKHGAVNRRSRSQTSLSASQRRLSGWWDLNPRPVAAATALPYLIKLISTSSGLVISLALRRFGASGEAFAVE